MKKYLALFLSLALLLTSIPFSVSAAESDMLNGNQLVELAKEVFPEYAEKLDGNGSACGGTPRTASSEIYPVVQKMRSVDSNTSMTYTEYNNGLIALGTARFVSDASYTVDDSEEYSNYTRYIATITAYVLEGPTFTATDVVYRIYPSNYDIIDSAGNYGIPGYAESNFRVSMNSRETATTAASVIYSVPCPVGMSNYSGQVIFHVQDNVAYAEFNVW